MDTLARAGFVTLAFELRGFGLPGDRMGVDHRLVAYNALLSGSFRKKVIIGDAADALKILLQHPNVDSARIGVAGVSLGGAKAVTLAAINRQIEAIYFSGYGGRVGEFGLAIGGKEDQPHYCHIIPGIHNLMRKEDVAILLAPRHALGLRGELEKPISNAFSQLMNVAWSNFDAPDKARFDSVPRGGHEFFVAEAITFFINALGEPVQYDHIRQR